MLFNTGCGFRPHQRHAGLTREAAFLSVAGRKALASTPEPCPPVIVPLDGSPQKTPAVATGPGPCKAGHWGMLLSKAINDTASANAPMLRNELDTKSNAPDNLSRRSRAAFSLEMSAFAQPRNCMRNKLM